MKDASQPANGQRIPNGMLQDNYPRNMWWVAARTDEVTTKPLARWLLETPVVLYRLEDGTPAAMKSRIDETLETMEMFDSWYAEMARLPRAVQLSAVKLGARVARFLPKGKDKT